MKRNVFDYNGFSTAERSAKGREMMMPRVTDGQTEERLG